MAGKEAGAEGGEEAGKEAGEQGGEEKKGTLKVVRKRASALKSIFDEIKITFEQWRMGGQYGDTEDLMDEVHKVAERKHAEFKGLQSGGKLSEWAQTCMLAIEQRLQALEKSEKNERYTLSQMLNHFNARLFKPQRLVSLTLSLIHI